MLIPPDSSWLVPQKGPINRPRQDLENLILFYQSKPPPLAVVGCGGEDPTPLAKQFYC